jgi:5-methylcytosine-specific restriction protein B
MQDLFLSQDGAEQIIRLLERKKNVVLQGPPGVGKSFVAKRLAFALIGKKVRAQVQAVQFHQSYSYEDFVQGYRPTPAGGFSIREGVFVRFCELARARPDERFVLIIDEVNRGNLSKIFGELMLLMEADKRGREWAVPLTYQDLDKPPFFVPPNLFLLGLMNTADRSLAMVDYALRRRFSFVDLKPEFESDSFSDFLKSRGASSEVIARIRSRLGRLNEVIRSDRVNLGPWFQIGHSFFCPNEGEIPDDRWYETVVRADVAPLLREYFFENSDRADELVDELLR